MDTNRSLNLRSAGKRREGCAFQVYNPNNVAKSLDDMTISFIGYDGEPPIYTMRSRAEDSKVDSSSDTYATISVPSVVNGLGRRSNISPKSTVDFTLYLDSSSDNEIELVLEEDGVEVDRCNIPD